MTHMKAARNDIKLLVKEAADYVTRVNGGSHAVREVCDLIVQHLC